MTTSIAVILSRTAEYYFKNTKWQNWIEASGSLQLICLFYLRLYQFEITGRTLTPSCCFPKHLPRYRTNGLPYGFMANGNRLRSVIDKRLAVLRFSLNLSSYYQAGDSDVRDFICSQPEDNGMTKCNELPPYVGPSGQNCNGTALPWNSASAADTGGECVNWNQYYSDCRPVGNNPFQGAISFDNIGLAWVAIFQVR